MPIYEYRCKRGHTFDVRQSFSDGPVTECEVCGKPVQRVFHPIAVHFKGSGFYNTDYGTRKRSREMKEAKNGSGGESGKDGAGASKSDSGDSKSDSGSSQSDSGSSQSDSGAKKAEPKTSSAASSGKG